MKSSRYLQILIYLIIAFIFIFIMGMTRNCSRINTASQAGFSGGDTIDIALLFGPGSFYMYGDTIAGINHDIALEFEKATLTPIKLWPLNEPTDGMAKLESGAFKILASLPLDNNIKKNFTVSESVFLDRLVLVQMRDSSGQSQINSSLDLQGKTVYVTAGSTAAQRMKNLAREIGGEINVSEESEVSDELLVLQVAAGSKQFAVVNERVAKDIAKHYPELDYNNTISFTQFQVWLFNNNDSALYKKFSGWFETFKTTQSYKDILKKY